MPPLSDSYGGNSVVAELDCIDEVIATPNSMFSFSQDQDDKDAGVIHDVESPSGDYADPLARGWLRSGEPHSIHAILDGLHIIQLLRLLAWCWGAGPKVNQRTVQVEQAGYVGFSTAMWLGIEKVGAIYLDSQGNPHTWTDAMNKQMAAQFVHLATFIAQVNHRFGWGVPRMGTQDDMNRFLQGVKVGVWFTHWMVSQWAGGTDHTDPMPHYPTALLMVLATQIYNGTKPQPPAPPVPPTPEPTFLEYIMQLDPNSAEYKKFQSDQAKVTVDELFARTSKVIGLDPKTGEEIQVVQTFKDIVFGGASTVGVRVLRGVNSIGRALQPAKPAVKK